MTNENLIEMALKANFARTENGDWVCTTEKLKRFAAMVAAAEQDECMKLLEHCATLDPNYVGVANASIEGILARNP